MATERLRPTSTVTLAAATDWAPSGGTLANSYQLLDDNPADDASYIEQANNPVVNGDAVEYHIGNPTASANTGVNWTVGIRARESTSVAGNTLNATVKQGATTIHTFAVTSALTTSPADHTSSFSPASVTDPNDLRVEIQGIPDGGGGGVPRVYEVWIDVVTGSSRRRSGWEKVMGF